MESDIFHINTLYVIRPYCNVHMSGRFTGEDLQERRCDVCVVVLPSFYLYSFSYLFYFDHLDVGEITQGSTNYTTLVLPSLNRLWFIWFFFFYHLDVGEIHRVVVYCNSRSPLYETEISFHQFCSILILCIFMFYIWVCDFVHFAVLSILNILLKWGPMVWCVYS